MFRVKQAKQNNATKTPEFPVDLTALRLFVDEASDQLRQLGDPEKGLQFRYYPGALSMDVHGSGERLNRSRGYAVTECVKRIALERLAALDIHPIRLPLEADSDPSIKHVQVLASKNLATARHILLVAPDTGGSALGVHSLRYATDRHIGDGTMETISRRALREEGYDAVLIANPATLYWDASKCTTVTSVGWKAGNLPTVRLSLPSSNPLGSTIPGHESPEQHLASLLDYLKSHIASNPENHKLKVDFVATGYSAYALLLYLDNDYSFWHAHVRAGVLAESGHSIRDFSDPLLREFIRLRCRNYTLDGTEPIGTVMSSSLVTEVATFSSGQSDFAANIVPAILPNIFAYFRKAYRVDAIRARPAAASPEIGESDNDGLEDEDVLNPPVLVSMDDDLGSSRLDFMSAQHTLHEGQEGGPPAAAAAGAVDEGWRFPSEEATAR